MYDFGSGLSLTKHTDALRSVKSLNTLFEGSREPFIQEEGAQDIDGGWAYMVFGTSILGHIFTFGVPLSAGLLYTAILEYDFGESEALTAIPFALTFASLHLLSPISNWSRERFGSRITIFAGCVLSSIGLVSGSFVRNVGQLIVTYGVMGGLGWALVYMVLISHLEDYFVTYRKIVTMAVSVGTGIATCIYPFIVSALLEAYGWRGALFVLGGLNLNLLLCVGAFKPNKFTEKLRSEERKIELRRFTSGSIFKRSSTNALRDNSTSSILRIPNHKKQKRSVILQRKLRSFITDFSLNNMFFQAALISHFLIALAVSACMMQLSNYLTSLHYSEPTVALLVALYGFCNAANRVLLSIFAYSFPWCICSMFETLIFLYGVFAIVITFCSGLVPIVICIIFLGITSAWFIMTPEIVFLTVGHLKFNKAFSALLMACGLGNLVAPPFSGWIYDITKGYAATFIVSGIISILGSIFNIPIWIRFTFC